MNVAIRLCFLLVLLSVFNVSGHISCSAGAWAESLSIYFQTSFATSFGRRSAGRFFPDHILQYESTVLYDDHRTNIYSTAEGCGGSFKKEIYGEVGCCESCTDGSNLLSLPLSICISLYLYLCQKICQGPQKQKLRADNRKSQRTDPGDVNARAQLCMDFCAPFILPSMRAIFLFIRDSMVFGDLGMTQA